MKVNRLNAVKNQICIPDYGWVEESCLHKLFDPVLRASESFRELQRAPESFRELQRGSESFRELQRAAIDDTEKLIKSFNCSKIFLSSCKPFQTV